MTKATLKKDPIDEAFVMLTEPAAEGPLVLDTDEEHIAERIALLMHNLADAIQVGLIRLPKLPPR